MFADMSNNRAMIKCPGFVRAVVKFNAALRRVFPVVRGIYECWSGLGYLFV
jgi:hypothetical protein